MKKVICISLVTVFLFFTALQVSAADYTAEEASKRNSLVPMYKGLQG
jgi:hypothetical protein